MKIIAALVLGVIIGINSRLNAQDLAAYTDYMNRFYIFDKGKNILLEDQKPQSFKIGGTCILYVNSAGHLYMYSDGKTELLEKSGVTDYYTGDYLAAYSIFEKLKVVYKGSVIELSNRCPNYFATDSLIVFYDKNAAALQLFYDGRISEIESGLLGTPVKYMAVSDNIFAYISERTNDFTIWYGGKTYLIEKNTSVKRFNAGLDIVAFNDENEQNFKIFYRGEVLTLEDFVVKSYRVGDGFVAYVNQTEEFKIFRNGQTQTISTFSPQSYTADDNLLIYTEDNRFKIWFDGDVTELEAFVPTLIKSDWNTVAYLDNSNRIWIFQNGEKKYFANELVSTFDIYRDLIFLNVLQNKNIIFYKNKFYQGNSFYK